MDLLTIQNLILVLIGVGLGLIPFFLGGKSTKVIIRIIITSIVEFMEKYGDKEITLRDLLMFIYSKLVEHNVNSKNIQSLEEVIRENDFDFDKKYKITKK